MTTNKWKITVQFETTFNWIDDGFDMQSRKEEIEEAFQNMLPYAFGHEVKVKIDVKDLAPSKSFNDAMSRSLS